MRFLLYVLLTASYLQSLSVSPNRDLRVIYPERREVAVPSRGQTALTNPPSFLWPVKAGPEVRYLVRLSRDRRFPPGDKTHSADLPWALYNPHRKLDQGTWYWQYAAVVGGQAPEWSKIFRFCVDGSARASNVPPPEDLVERFAASRPRVLASQIEVNRFRSRLKGSGELERVSQYVERYLGKHLPTEVEGQPKETSSDAFKARNFAKWASKAFAADVLEPIVDLVPTYLLTGNQKYAREAMRRALHIARLDPEGVTDSRVSDFADGSCMRAMALVYDSCFDLLDGSERRLLLDAMGVRAKRFYAKNVNNLEARVFSAHIWQHILMEFAEVAFATIGEIPEADEWAAYIYELWINRFPLLGGDDGGWANGVNYFGSNIETLLDMPALLGRFSGSDLMDHPWYRNVPYYQIYSWPPGSFSDGFGDGAEREQYPPENRAFFLESLGRKFKNPYALWYAREVAGRGQRVEMSPMELLRRMRWKESAFDPKAPSDLPQARAFRDVGVVSMHTSLSQPSKDLMVAFRSSPFGAYNHMHASQNSFNVLYGGDRLFSNSGYYLTYGDDHFRDWYTATKGHNSVLVDGQGQPKSTRGFGWIPRFLHGEQISYCLGDASHAYPESGLEKFRRHVVLLRPNIIVLYDELAAAKNVEWSWLIHSKHPITVAPNESTFFAEAGKVKARVDLIGSQSVKTSLSTEFNPPADNWRKKKVGDAVFTPPDQWHLTAAPENRSRLFRILAVIQVGPGGNDKFAPPEKDERGGLRIGDWWILAGLDPMESGSLVIERLDQTALLVADRRTYSLGTASYNLPASATLLVEESGSLVKTSKDELPMAAR